jgi:hypothetical protein
VYCKVAKQIACLSKKAVEIYGQEQPQYSIVGEVDNSGIDIIWNLRAPWEPPPLGS